MPLGDVEGPPSNSQLNCGVLLLSGTRGQVSSEPAPFPGTGTFPLLVCRRAAVSDLMVIFAVNGTGGGAGTGVSISVADCVPLRVPAIVTGVAVATALVEILND